MPIVIICDGIFRRHKATGGKSICFRRLGGKGQGGKGQGGKGRGGEGARGGRGEGGQVARGKG